MKFRNSTDQWSGGKTRGAWSKKITKIIPGEKDIHICNFKKVGSACEVKNYKVKIFLFDKWVSCLQKKIFFICAMILGNDNVRTSDQPYLLCIWPAKK